jgi:hypothetical protein
MQESNRELWKKAIEKNYYHSKEMCNMVVSNFTEGQLSEDYPAAKRSVEAYKKTKK